MKRKIIKIDEDKCNGCGACIPNCAEGALQMIDNKARLISDLFCDGLGACIGTCPQGAIEIEERESEPYNEYIVMENIIKGGENVIKAHLKHLNEHKQDEFVSQAIAYLNEHNIAIPDYKEEKKPLACGCPGHLQKDLTKERTNNLQVAQVSTNMQSELNNWPIQLKLLNPNAPYLKNSNLVIAADCTAFAYANFHSKFLKDRVLVMFCPKLDTNLDEYVDKLTEIFQNQNIQSVTIVHMEVPCCGGVEAIVKQAILNSKENIIMKDYTVSITGELI